MTDLPLAVTMGEPAGVGGDLMLLAWCRGGVPPFFVLDDPDRLTALARRLDLAVPVTAIDAPEAAAAVFPEALPVLPVPLAAAVAPGAPDPANGRAVQDSIERAVALVTGGRAAAVVTNPIHKAVLQQSGFHHPGHTEYLAALAGGHAHPVMMLACEGLRVVPVTVHVSLAEAVRTLSREAVVTKGRITARALGTDFGIAAPRLAVAGLNPHAGEDGRMGTEDRDVVAPAVDALRAAGIDAFGPLPADTMFHAGARATYDAALCQYHDQALIPLKTLDFAGGVNITLGLPFVRTSPDHGTALGLAGTGRADPTSLINALTTAAAMARRRARAA